MDGERQRHAPWRVELLMNLSTKAVCERPKTAATDNGVSFGGATRGLAKENVLSRLKGSFLGGEEVRFWENDCITHGCVENVVITSFPCGLETKL